MTTKQKVLLIINAVIWGIIVAISIVSGIFSDGSNCMGIILFFGFILLFNVLDIVLFSDSVSLFATIAILITVSLGVLARDTNISIRDRAVTLYESGQYEESMDEFMKIKDTGFANKYVEKDTVYKLRGTDIEVIVKEDN